MFGFSIQKLLLLAAIIGAVWYGFKLIGRLDQARKAEGRLRDGGKPSKPAWWPGRDTTGAGGGQSPVEAEDMVQCSVCQAYVPARGAKACGRPNCPYG